MSRFLSEVHEAWLIEAAPALASAALRTRLSHAKRLGARLDALLAGRLGADPAAALEGRAAVLAVEPARLERRLLLVGAVSYAPAFARMVAREDALRLRAALGPALLRVALAHASALGGDETPPPSADNAEALRAAVAARAADHLAAWLPTLPRPAMRAILLRLDPDGPFAPRDGRAGDASLIDRLAPAFAALEDAEA